MLESIAVPPELSPISEASETHDNRLNLLKESAGFLHEAQHSRSVTRAMSCSAGRVRLFHRMSRHRSIWVPISITSSDGIPKYDVALAALRARNANSRSLTGPSSPRAVARNVSRPR